MQTTLLNSKRREEGSILVYFIAVGIVAVAIASACTYVTVTTRLTHRRSDMIAATQYAQGGAVLACSDLNSAMTNTASSVFSALTSLSTPYTLSSTLSTSSQKTYTRTISSPFTSGQTVPAQISLPNVSSPTSAKIVATATVGSVTQSTTVNVKMAWAYPAAIISVSDGTAETVVQKSTGQDGNVVVNGDKSGPT